MQKVILAIALLAAMFCVTQESRADVLFLSSGGAVHVDPFTGLAFTAPAPSPLNFVQVYSGPQALFVGRPPAVIINRQSPVVIRRGFGRIVIR